jgi:ArsR family transcriptional regulator
MKTKACLCKNISEIELKQIEADMPNEELTNRLSEFFKVFGDNTRLRILYYLSRHELCVADLSSLVKMQQSAVSHQLKLLKLNRLVKFRKEGTTFYYSLDDKHIESVFEVALEHLKEL